MIAALSDAADAGEGARVVGARAVVSAVEATVKRMERR